MIYRLDYDSTLSLAHVGDYSIFKTWKNPEPIQEWQPISVIQVDTTSPFNVTGLNSIMIWETTLINNCPSSDYQALPVTMNDTIYYAIHITRVLDCLDAGRSVFKRFKNRNIGVEHYVLKADCVEDAHLFTIPDDGHSAIFASERFKSQVEEQGWTGLTFTPVELSE